MKIATLHTPGGPRPAVLDGTVWRLLDAPDVRSMLGKPRSELRWADAPPIDMSDARHAAPVPNPGKVICVGLNYRSHAAEMGLPIPKYPNLWAKFAESMIGPDDGIHLPPESPCCDYEVELTIVIGRDARRVDERDAAAAIAGYCVGNDTSVRDWQVRTREALQGKAWEGMTPTGPCITSLDDLGDASNLYLRTYLNGELRQDGSTSDMVFSPAWLVSYISTFVTLKPGDLILTGTPSGVGFTRKPPLYLKPGDLVRCEIQGLGAIENRCL
ncbi:MAG: fumarylacetoacetate hydrolase family protein [Casimicrobiaceae bacterium]